jgi:hypothetical protein
MGKKNPKNKKHENLSEKQTKAKGVGGVAQEVDCLPSRCKALSSSLSRDKKKKSLSLLEEIKLDPSSSQNKTNAQ